MTLRFLSAIRGTVAAAVLFFISLSPLTVWAAFQSCDTVTGIPVVECEALEALYHSTDGDNWKNNTNWLQTETPCDWYGVTCETGHVVRLVLGGNGLNGPIPLAIGNLASLKYLSLQKNNLIGQIPGSLGNLTQLLHLFISENKLNGEIPDELGNLDNLLVFTAMINELTGPIPSALANMTSLEKLWLYRNQLSGEIPSELENLKNLIELSLYNNQLTGPVPPQLGDLTNLTYLGLSGNQLTGHIPCELINLTKLQTLNLGANQLTGIIPECLGMMTSLTERLDLIANNLTGSIPLQLGNLTNLKALHLAKNDLTGSIPPELGDMTSLIQLVLSNTNLTGNIPLELCNLKNLKALVLDSTKISGDIPFCIGEMTSLEGLSAGNNVNLEGTLPKSIGKLEKLKRISIANNGKMSGELPGTLTNLSLQQFWYYNTQLCEPPTTEFQTWLSEIPDLRGTGVLCDLPSVTCPPALYSPQARTVTADFFALELYNPMNDSLVADRLMLVSGVHLEILPGFEDFTTRGEPVFEDIIDPAENCYPVYSAQNRALHFPRVKVPLVGVWPPGFMPDANIFICYTADMTESVTQPLVFRLDSAVETACE